MAKIKDLPEFKRPREKLFEKGSAALTNVQLLAILLRTGYQGKSALEVARRVLKTFPLEKISQSTSKELAKIKGVGKSRAAIICAAFSLAGRLAPDQGNLIVSPEDVAKLTVEYQNKRKEYLIGIYLDARKHLLAKKVISIGTLDTSLIHPREVFAPAIAINASSVIVVHNHPSGDPKPSLEDRKITGKLSKAGELLGISLVDHLIITGNGFYSFKREGFYLTNLN